MFALINHTFPKPQHEILQCPPRHNLCCNFMRNIIQYDFHFKAEPITLKLWID